MRSLKASLLLGAFGFCVVFMFLSKTPGPDSDLLARLQGPVPWDDPGLVELLRESYLVPPSALPYNLSTDPLYNRLKTYGSYGFLRRRTEELVDGHRDGFFVEAGALDGERVSNSLWLEKDLGWSGLLVEPDPENYSRLVSKRRKAWITNTCLAPRPFPHQEVFVSLTRKQLPEAQFYRTLWEHRAVSHLLSATVNSSLYDELYQSSDRAYSVAQCFPLASFLLALDVQTVDLLSLDIQGVEKEVLRTLPWKDLNIRIVVVEIVSHEKTDWPFVREMEDRGYALYAYGGEDYVFVRKGDAFLANGYRRGKAEDAGRRNKQ